MVYDGWYRLERLRILMPDGAAVERHLLATGRPPPPSFTIANAAL
ncbi:hypothetical protein [Novosphingobium resinovorum]|nr:hypothetical protein [Novosphingobium resinovorum]